MHIQENSYNFHTKHSNFRQNTLIDEEVTQIFIENL